MSTDPNMGFTNPDVGVTAGPTYAQNIKDALTTIGAHTHTGAPTDGALIPATALDINADVSWQSNDITSLRSARFTEQSVTLGASGDVGCFYNKGGDAYWNNGTGTPVQLTSGTNVNVSASNTTWSRLAVSTDITIANSDQYVDYDVVTNASRQITLPTAASVAPGRRYVFRDASGTGADTNNITLVRSGSDTFDGATSFIIRSLRGTAVVWSDGSSTWHVFATYNPEVGNIRLNDGTIGSDGTLTISASGALTLESAGSTASLTADSAFSITSTTDDVTLDAGDDIALTAIDQIALLGGGDVDVTSSGGNASLSAGAIAQVDGATQVKVIVGGTNSIKMQTNGGTNTVVEAKNNQLGFYNATPVSKQTGVAVTAAALHAALVNLGLISA